MRRIGVIGVLVCVCVLNPCTRVLSDDIEDEIETALTAYQEGAYTKAVSSLEFATQQIRKLKAEKIAAYFPGALPGWIAEEPKSVAVGSMFMGGAVSGSKKYRKGDAVVEISITADNPMISFVSGIISNPAMLSMASQFGGVAEVVKVKKRKALSEWDSREMQGSLRLVVGTKALVSVTGSYCGESDLVMYAEAIDYDGIESFLAE